MPEPRKLTRKIADYALAGDMRTGMLVHCDGSIDWWCAPRFDSGAIFARLLGDENAGFWRIAPRERATVTRRYRPESLVLETTYETAQGAATLTDALPLDTARPTIVRTVTGVHGEVAMHMCLRPRTYFGKVTPWTRLAGEWIAVAAPDALVLRGDVTPDGADGEATADFAVTAGRRVTFALQWFPAHEAPPAPVDDPAADVDRTDRWWRDWAGRLSYAGPWRDAVVRSALTLKALTDRRTGGLIAALTTSLPEHVGGDRNWDYRYCWIRDASFAFVSLNAVGARDELFAWCDWFLRVYAGAPNGLDIMYGAGGERLMPEERIPWLGGYRGSRPVRIGNDAHEQVQLGIVGDLTTSLVAARDAGWHLTEERWRIIRPLLDHLERAWKRPGNGIWELRGEPRHYVHSKGMAWCAAWNLAALAAPHDPDTAQRAVELAERIRTSVERNGFNRRRGAFVESYGSTALDASVLLLPLRGFLPPDDPRIVSTVAAIERSLVYKGYVFRYSPDIVRRGGRVRTKEGAFAMCGFWLVQLLLRQGRRRDAQVLFERLLRTANDVGLLSEEYDVASGEPIGNTPQAFSHSGLIDAAVALSGASR